MYMSLQMKTSFFKFIVQSTKRHPRVIDLDRGKTLAKGNVHCISPYSAVKDPGQFGRSVTAVMYSSNKL